MALIKEQDATFSEVPPFFKDRLILRVKESSFGPNSGGNPMITIKCEVVDPLTKSVDGKTYALDSFDITYWFTLDDKNDTEKGRKNRGRYLKFLKKMGLPQEFDSENPDRSYLDGLCFAASLSSREKIAQRRLDEVSESGRPQFEAIKDAEGKPVSQGWEWVAQTDDILYRVDGVQNRPY